MAQTFNSIAEIESAIKAQITTRPERAIKAMLNIFRNQTEDEQAVERVEVHNGVGFTQVDAEILSSFAKQYQSRGWLSPKQTALLMRRIGKYAGQLTRQAIAAGLYVKEGRTWSVA